MDTTTLIDFLVSLGFKDVEEWQIGDENYVQATDPKTGSTINFLPQWSFLQVLDYIEKSRKQFQK